jgi:molybdopterin-guanine dinucleotide biosynthesis protein
MTIPELVAELEERGYRKAEFVESDQRGIIVDVVTPGGDQVRLKYLAGTGRVVHAEDENED